METENIENISIGTIVRTITLVIVIINMILKANGKDLINISHSEIVAFVEYAVEIAVIIVNWWCNNNLTRKARRAQTILQQIKKNEE